MRQVGKLKYSHTKFLNRKNSITIDLSELNNGIYFCQLYSNDHFQTVKLIKK
ncbi:MAG: T9SS type A sorting domain-containing protein [Bacteroidetes bacterium]|nr:T9SS type A sorting domain-containing protein [Bacteroidota bacterium]